MVSASLFIFTQDHFLLSVHYLSLIVCHNISYAGFQHNRWTRTSLRYFYTVCEFELTHYFALKKLDCFLYFFPIKSADLNTWLTSWWVAWFKCQFLWILKQTARTLQGIPWNSMDTQWNTMNFPSNSMELFYTGITLVGYCCENNLHNR